MGPVLPKQCRKCFGVTDWGTYPRAPSRTASRAASLIRLARSAPTCICEPVGEVSQATSCGSGEDIQATACEPFVEREPPVFDLCACEKYLFPTFELETLGWSWEPITDDDGIHEPDRCLFGVSESEKEDDQ